MAWAASYPLTWPGSTSDTERAPEMSHRTLPTPTSWYCAAIRFAGLGRYSGETRPSEVESPMWVTAWQEVRSEAAGVLALLEDAASAGLAPFFRPPARAPAPRGRAVGVPAGREVRSGAAGVLALLEDAASAALAPCFAPRPGPEPAWAEPPEVEPAELEPEVLEPAVPEPPVPEPPVPEPAGGMTVP